MDDLGSEAQAYVNLFRRRWASGADKKMLLSISRYYPQEARDYIKRHYHLGDPSREDLGDDSEWWWSRVDKINAMADPTRRWREAMGMRETLLRDLAFPRPDLIDALTRIANAAELEGADTNSQRVKKPMKMTIDQLTARARGWTLREEKDPDT